MRVSTALDLSLTDEALLASMGIPAAALLVQAVERGEAIRALHTSDDPPNARGTAVWGGTVRALREILREFGWTARERNGLSLTVSPDESIAVVVATGDELTGLDGTPSTRHRKGTQLADAVEDNQIALGQLSPEFAAWYGEQPDRADDGALTYWLLLRCRTDREIRCELSLPNGMVDGKIVSWKKRIVLSTVATNPVPAVHPVGLERTPEITIEISRKNR